LQEKLSDVTIGLCTWETYWEPCMVAALHGGHSLSFSWVQIAFVSI
jgi:hypothetical protein